MSDLIDQAKLATDTISRAAAIEVIENELDKIDHVPQWVFNRLINRLRELPSAQPEPLTINFARELDRETIEKVKESMKNAPVLIMAVNDDSAQPEREKGQWLEHYSHEDGERDGVECSKCRTHYYFGGQLMNFCPNCGAEMRGEEG